MSKLKNALVSVDLFSWLRLVLWAVVGVTGGFIGGCWNAQFLSRLDDFSLRLHCIACAYCCL
jgi:hypothetical protein